MTKGFVVNFWAAPGAGKSTMAAGLFHRLKCLRINTELTNEYAKDLVWSGRTNELKDQFYVFAKQRQRVERLVNNCDVTISDSPILMANVYLSEEHPTCLRDTLLWSWNQYDNINFLIDPQHEYDPVGRTQTKQQADMVHQDIIELLEQYSVPHHTVPSNDAGLNHVVDTVVAYMSNRSAN